MNEYEAWVATCHLSVPGVDGRYQCLVAMWATDSGNFRTKLVEHVTQQGYGLLRLEQVLPSLEFTRLYGPQQHVIDLARRVHLGHPIEFSHLVPSNDPDQPQIQNHLSIEPLDEIEPLDAQFGVHPQLIVPPALQEPLFGQPDLTGAEIKRFGAAQDVPKMQTYMVLDAAKLPFILTALLESSELRYQSLFQGRAEHELKEYAPYLVRLDPENRFTQKLFTGADGTNGLWHKELGVFVRSRAEFDVVRKHFRKFTRVQDANAKWYYFRFWEAENTHTTSDLVHDDHSPFVRIWNNPVIAEALHQSDNQLWRIKAQGGEAQSIGQSRLKGQDIEAIKATGRRRFLAKVCKTLEEEHSDLWKTTDSDEVLQIYKAAYVRKYTIEKSTYDFIRGTLRARKQGIDFYRVEHEIDPAKLLSPLKRAKRIWAYLDKFENQT